MVQERRESCPPSVTINILKPAVPASEIIASAQHILREGTVAPAETIAVLAYTLTYLYPHEITKQRRTSGVDDNKWADYAYMVESDETLLNQHYLLLKQLKQKGAVTPETIVLEATGANDFDAVRQPARQSTLSQRFSYLTLFPTRCKHGIASMRLRSFLEEHAVRFPDFSPNETQLAALINRVAKQRVHQLLAEWKETGRLPKGIILPNDPEARIIT